ncbi:MAG: hypothetical protein L6Q98_02515 [Anaerolineae bacterium]|nr:hypothetical protein [Anaerolineae bacterium]NUQ02950.1 hypothetical protein [Anaerolineae bacterium]
MRYWGPIRALGGWAAIMGIIGFLFPSLRESITDETARNGVLLQAVPFVAFFIAFLLLYALLIVLVARTYNGRIPNRAHNPILSVLIAGILLGVVLLFQPLHIVGYRYGFLLLLVSTFGFILWSHVVPKSARLDMNLPKIAVLQHVAGLIAGAAILIVLTTSAISANTPVEPYGVRQRVWDRYDDARKAEIRDLATSDFNNVEIPFLILLNLFPAVLIYFAVREASGAFVGNPGRIGGGMTSARESA